jgi:hypothetical protein
MTGDHCTRTLTPTPFVHLHVHCDLTLLDDF